MAGRCHCVLLTWPVLFCFCTRPRAALGRGEGPGLQRRCQGPWAAQPVGSKEAQCRWPPPAAATQTALPEQQFRVSGLGPCSPHTWS